MNIILNCCAEKGWAGYSLEKSGRVIEKDSYKLPTDDSSKLKEFVFDAIIKGLKVARMHINHDDLLLIALQNAHMVEWLNGSRDYQGYEKYLDDISDIIETLDCRYLFAKKDMKKVKKMLSEYSKKEVLTSASSLLEEFE